MRKCAKCRHGHVTPLIQVKVAHAGAGCGLWGCGGLWWCSGGISQRRCGLGGVCTGCHVTVGRGGGALGQCKSGLWWCNGPEVAHAGDGTDRLVDLRRPIEPLGFTYDLVGCVRWYWCSLISSLSNPLVSCFFSPGTPVIPLSCLLLLVVPY